MTDALHADAVKLAERVVEYFGEEDIPACLECDIELRDVARAFLASHGGTRAGNEPRESAPESETT